jgi:sec-independent protein translocase protein TatA
MFGVGFQELMVIFLIVFLLFGAKALPEIAKGLGQAIRIFKKEAKDWKEDSSPQSPASPSSAKKEDQA